MERVFLEYMGDSVEVPLGETVIGRDVGCAMRFNDPSVSRRHLRFIRRQGELFVEDLGSSNGTLLNGSSVKAALRIVDGDKVSVGTRLLTVRVIDESAVFGVYCRRFGVPLIDGGTVRLPRAIGMSRALDMILTGRSVAAEEALHIGLANRVVPRGEHVSAARELASQLAALPQLCLRSDRRSAYEQWGLPESAAIQNEFGHGLGTLRSGESVAGAARFTRSRQ